MTGRLINVAEVADYLRVKPSTIYQWTHEKYIPHIKVGNQVRFKVAAIDVWLDRNSVAGRKSRRVGNVLNGG